MRPCAVSYTWKTAALPWSWRGCCWPLTSAPASPSRASRGLAGRRGGRGNPAPLREAGRSSSATAIGTITIPPPFGCRAAKNTSPLSSPRALRACAWSPARSWSGTGFGSRPSAPRTLASAFWCAPRGLPLPRRDFNLWHWREDHPAEIQEAYALYEAVLQPLLPYGDHIDIAFFPVDPRMGKTTMEGALDFARQAAPPFDHPHAHAGGRGPWAWPSNGPWPSRAGPAKCPAPIGVIGWI